MLICLGLDFRNADIRTRERFLPSEDRIRVIRAGPPPAPLREAALLPTCNRIELYAWTEGPASAAGARAASRAAARLWMGDLAGSRALLETATLRMDDEAVDHLLRVCAGLESQVLGDIHILGQVRRAFREAMDSGTLGSHLHRLFETALRCGKAVRRDTSLMAGRSSVGSEAARLLLSRIAGARGRLVVVGTGKIGSHAARVLAEAGHRELVLVNRTPSRAEALAAALGGSRIRVAPLDRLHDELAEADGVLVASGAPSAVVDAPSLHAARANAGAVGHSLVLVDASMPRNVDHRCGSLPGVTLLDLDALDPGAAAVERARQAAIPEAEAVVSEHRADFQRWRSEAAAREALRPLREMLSDLCLREVGYAAGDDVAGRATSRIVARLLAGPMTVLREASERGESVTEVAEALRVLFPAGEASGNPESFLSR